MTYEQEREAQYNARKAQERERNIQKVQTAQSWANALIVFENFIRVQRGDCANRLETGAYRDDYELKKSLRG